MTSKDPDKVEKERWVTLGRGYNYMTDEEVAKDIIRRFGKAKPEKKK